MQLQNLLHALQSLSALTIGFLTGLSVHHLSELDYCDLCACFCSSESMSTICHNKKVREGAFCAIILTCSGPAHVVESLWVHHM